MGMFYFAVLEFVHFTNHEVSSAHTPNRNAACGHTVMLVSTLCFDVNAHACAVCAVVGCIFFLCAFVYVCQKKKTKKPPENSCVSH